MSDFTSKVKGAVSRATSAARDMAQETTAMKDKLEQDMYQEDQDYSQEELDLGQGEKSSSKMAPEQILRGEQARKVAKEQLPGDEQFAVSEFHMSPVSQESQKLAGSMEKEQMGSGLNDQVHDNDSQAEMGSTAKDRMFDSKLQIEMGKSNMPVGQCMAEPGNTASQS